MEEEAGISESSKKLSISGFAKELYGLPKLASRPCKGVFQTNQGVDTRSTDTLILPFIGLMSMLSNL